MKVFISYPPKEAPLARAIAAGLHREGLQTWLAADELFPGDNWAERTGQALNECDAMVALVTAEASQVQLDMGFALGHAAYSRRLIPVLVGGDVPATALPWILERFPVLQLEHRENAGEVVREIVHLLAAAV